MTVLNAAAPMPWANQSAKTQRVSRATLLNALTVLACAVAVLGAAPAIWLWATLHQQITTFPMHLMCLPVLMGIAPTLPLVVLHGVGAVRGRLRLAAVECMAAPLVAWLVVAVWMFLNT